MRWDELVVVNLPNPTGHSVKGFQDGQGPAGNKATRLIVACAKLLEACGEDANDYAEQKADGQVPTDFEELTRQLVGGAVTPGQRRKVVRPKIVGQLDKNLKKKKKKKKKRTRKETTTSSSSSSSEDDFLPRRKKQKTAHHSPLVQAPARPGPAVPSSVPTPGPLGSFVRDEFFTPATQNVKIIFKNQPKLTSSKRLRLYRMDHDAPLVLHQVLKVSFHPWLKLEMLNFASLKLLPDDGRDTNLDEGKFEPIGSVLQLHACKQGLDLIAFNCRKVFDIKVQRLILLINAHCPSTANSFTILTSHPDQGAEDEGVLRFAVSDGRFYTDNVFLQPEVAAKFKFSRRKSYAVR